MPRCRAANCPFPTHTHAQSHKDMHKCLHAPVHTQSKCPPACLLTHTNTLFITLARMHTIALKWNACPRIWSLSLTRAHAYSAPCLTQYTASHQFASVRYTNAYARTYTYTHACLTCTQTSQQLLCMSWLRTHITYVFHIQWTHLYWRPFNTHTHTQFSHAPQSPTLYVSPVDFFSPEVKSSS